MIKDAKYGAIAQLVEHLNGIEGASGSNPLSSIQLKPSRGAVVDCQIIWQKSYQIWLNTHT